MVTRTPIHVGPRGGGHHGRHRGLRNADTSTGDVTDRSQSESGFGGGGVPVFGGSGRPAGQTDGNDGGNGDGSSVVSRADPTPTQIASSGISVQRSVEETRATHGKDTGGKLAAGTTVSDSAEVDRTLAAQRNQIDIGDEDEDDPAKKVAAPHARGAAWYEGADGLLGGFTFSLLRSRLLRGLGILWRGVKLAFAGARDLLHRAGRGVREGRAERNLTAAQREQRAAQEANLAQREARLAREAQQGVRTEAELARGVRAGQTVTTEATAAARLTSAGRNVVQAERELAAIARLPRQLRSLRAAGGFAGLVAGFLVIPAAVSAAVAYTRRPGETVQDTVRMAYQAGRGTFMLMNAPTQEEAAAFHSGDSRQMADAAYSYSGVPDALDFLGRAYRDPQRAWETVRAYGQLAGDVYQTAVNNPEAARQAAVTLGDAANNPTLRTDLVGAAGSRNPDDLLRAGQTALGDQRITSGVLRTMDLTQGGSVPPPAAATPVSAPGSNVVRPNFGASRPFNPMREPVPTGGAEVSPLAPRQNTRGDRAALDQLRTFNVSMLNDNIVPPERSDNVIRRFMPTMAPSPESDAA